jgi:hypothetical protein
MGGFILVHQYDHPTKEHPMEITLISALPGDRVPGHELADPDCPDIPGLTERPEVQAFFDANRYGTDDDELMYLVTDPDAEVPAGHPALALTI